MTTRLRLFLVAGIAGAILVLICLTLFLVPDRELQNLVARLAQQQGYVFRAERFGKAFPVGVKGVGLVLSNDRGPLLKADRASVQLGLLPLLTGKIILTCRADIGPGQIKGDFSPRTSEVNIEAKGIHLEDIPFFPSVTGASVAGEFSFACRFREKGREPGGELRLEVKKANIAGVKVSEMPLPVVENGVVQGMIRQKDNAFKLESFTLQVDGLYARLKGDFPLSTPLVNAPLNLTLELMPKPEFLDKQKFVFLLFTKYLISPGNYRIPISGTLAKPIFM
jgi:type II secretion system protein N